MVRRMKIKYFLSSHKYFSRQVVVLAVASLCLAEPEADPLHYYAPYGYAGYAPYYYRPYYASG